MTPNQNLMLVIGVVLTAPLVLALLVTAVRAFIDWCACAERWEKERALGLVILTMAVVGIFLIMCAMGKI